MRAVNIEPGLDSDLSGGTPPPSAFAPMAVRTSDAPVPEADPPHLKGFFITRDGKSFAGSHLIVDLRNASHLHEVEYIEQTLIDAVNAAGASLLHIYLHRFSPGGGISGVALLAESHISIHTWPEHAFAAVDVFVCGQCNPHEAIPVFQRAFAAGSIDVQEVLRGEVRRCE